jgi:hypothetical protein
MATTESLRASPHSIPQQTYFNYRSPYFGHPAFPSFAHVEAIRFPPAIHFPPQGTHPPGTGTYIPFVTSTSPIRVPFLPPLGAPSYPYPLPPVPYNRAQQFPPFSTPVSPHIHPRRTSGWPPIPFQHPPTRSPTQRGDSSTSTSQVSSTPISSASPVHTQPSGSTESLAAPPAPPAPAATSKPVVDQQRQMFSSAPVLSRENRLLDVPTRPSSAPAVFPATAAAAAATAPHDAGSRPTIPTVPTVPAPTVPVTQCSEASELGRHLPPDLPNSRTTGRRHKQ